MFKFLFWKGHSDFTMENGFQPGLFISYSFPGERDYKSDRQHMWSKWRKKYMRLFIKREAEEEINEET